MQHFTYRGNFQLENESGNESDNHTDHPQDFKHHAVYQSSNIYKWERYHWICARYRCKLCLQAWYTGLTHFKIYPHLEFSYVEKTKQCMPRDLKA